MPITSRPFATSATGSGRRTGLPLGPMLLAIECRAPPMIQRSLRFATFLAPNMLPIYRFIIHYVGCRLGCRTELFVGASYEEMTAGADGGFICGLPYVGLMGGRESPVRPLVAPVLRGKRYGGRPIYYSDVIVRRDSSLRS